MTDQPRWAETKATVIYELWDNEDLLCTTLDLDQMRKICSMTTWKPKGKLRVVMSEVVSEPVAVCEEHGLEFLTEDVAKACLEKLSLSGKMVQ